MPIIASLLDLRDPLPSLVKIIKLILLEAADQGALMPLQNDLRHQLYYPLSVEKLHNVDLVAESLPSLVVPLESLETPLEPWLVLQTAAAKRAH